MKNLNELKINIISCKEVAKTNELKDELYNINEILYKYSKRYVNNKIKDKLLFLITFYGKEISKYDTKTALGLKKKQYLISQLRIYYSILKQYQPDETDYDNIAERSYKYQLSQYLRNKQKILSNVDSIIKMLNEMDEVYQDWGNEPSIKYREATRELTQAFMSKYAILKER